MDREVEIKLLTRQVACIRRVQIPGKAIQVQLLRVEEPTSETSGLLFPTHAHAKFWTERDAAATRQIVLPMSCQMFASAFRLRTLQMRQEQHLERSICFDRMHLTAAIV
jgi:hypothetical protein